MIYVGAIIFAIVAASIGGSVLYLIRIKVTSQNPIMALGMSIIVAILAILFITGFLGFERPALSSVVLGTMIGTVFVWEKPFEVSALVNSIAITTGILAIYSALMSDLYATIFSLLATGILIRLDSTFLAKTSDPDAI